MALLDEAIILDQYLTAFYSYFHTLVLHFFYIDSPQHQYKQDLLIFIFNLST